MLADLAVKQRHLVYEANIWRSLTVTNLLLPVTCLLLRKILARSNTILQGALELRDWRHNLIPVLYFTMSGKKTLPIPPRVSISNLKLVLPDACVPEPGPLAESLFCLLLGAKLSVLDADESLIPLESDARPESLDGLLTVSAADVTVPEAVAVEVDRLSLDVGAGGVDVVVVDNFLFSSLNCSCCFRAKDQQHVRQHSL